MKLEVIRNNYKDLLSLYLSGAILSNSSKILFPFVNRVHPGLKSKVLSIKRVLTSFCKTNINEGIDRILVLTAARLEEIIYNSHVNNEKVKITTKKNISFVCKTSRIQILNLFQEYLESNLRQDLEDAYIHGSISTFDFTDYSDLDTLFLIKNETLKSVEKLRMFRIKYIESLKYLYEFDPLQHHPHFILAEFELMDYNQSFLPIPTLRLMTSLLSKKYEFELILNQSDKNINLRFKRSLYSVQRLADVMSNDLQNPYKLKLFLSHIMILPVLYLQIRGINVSKKDSFVLFKEEVPQHVYSIIDYVSEIRQRWTQLCPWVWQPWLRFIAEYNPLLFPFFSNRAIRINSISTKMINDEFVKNVYNFVDFLSKSLTGPINVNKD